MCLCVCARQAFARNFTERTREKERVKERAKEKEKERKAQQKKKKVNDLERAGQKSGAAPYGNKQVSEENPGSHRKTIPYLFKRIQECARCLCRRITMVRRTDWMDWNNNSRPGIHQDLKSQSKKRLSQRSPSQTRTPRSSGA